MRRIITSITLASGGIVAAATALGVAAADPDATTISVPDPFGVTFVGAPDFSYQTGDASEGIAYGQQTIDLDSANFGPYVDQFFTDNVTVDGQPLNLSTNPLIASDVQADIIDKLQTNGVEQQQIVLPSIPGTNIESGVIDVHEWNGYGYAIIDLVGPGTTSNNSNGVDNAIGAWLITPQGPIDESSQEDGGAYGGQAYTEHQLFDLSNPPSDPFGVTLEGDPDITYQTGGVVANTAYGSQTIDFNSSDLAPFVQQFFTSNVTVDGQPLNLSSNPLTDADLQAHIIDNVKFDGPGISEQQILLPSVDGTNIDHGVIDIDNFGNGYSYDYVDLVGPGTTHLGSNGVDDAIGAWLVTPMGTYDVSPFAGLEAQMFDPSAFDPSSFFPDAGLTPPFFFLS